MSAFVGIDLRGVWVTEGERDSLLDWLASHCPEIGRDASERCRSDLWRWMGCGIELRDVLSEGVRITATQAQLERFRTVCPTLPKLLRVVDALQCGTWRHEAGSIESQRWRDG
jgi:hypothetical protein